MSAAAVFRPLVWRPAVRRLARGGGHLFALASAVLALVVFSATDASAQEVVEYYATDAVGSIRVVFAPNGTVKARSDYLPFGEEVEASTLNGPLPTQRFTGQQRDTEEGHDNFNARSYQTRTGRFSTVDPVFAGSVENPQRWNRYRYAGNNPLTFTDPTGMWDSCTGEGPFGFTCVDYGGAQINPSGYLFWDLGSGGWACGGARICVTENLPKLDPVAPGFTGGDTGSEDGDEDPPTGTNGPVVTGTTTNPPPPGNPGNPSGGVLPPGARTPVQGQPPNSVRTNLFSDGTSQIRLYAPDGRATYDIDIGRDHGRGDPHAHRWDWTGRAQRIAMTFSQFVQEMKNLVTQPIILVNPCLMSGFSSVCRGNQFGGEF